MTRLLFPCSFIFSLSQIWFALSFEVLVRKKRTWYFLSVTISYFLCHRNCQLNFTKFNNFFRPYLSVFFITCFLFLCYSNIIGHFGGKVLPPNSGYKFIHILFSFSLRFASFAVIYMDEWIALLYRSASKSSTPTNFLVLLADKYLNIFSLIVIVNLSITQDFSSFSVE